MSYDICIAAAGTPVLGYIEDGSYDGYWIAFTAQGFYTGSYGSCSGCDWREADRAAYMRTNGWVSPDEATAHAIDAGIGREILKDAAMSRVEILHKIADYSLKDKDAVLAWIDLQSPEACA